MSMDYGYALRDGIAAIRPLMLNIPIIIMNIYCISSLNFRRQRNGERDRDSLLSPTEAFERWRNQQEKKQMYLFVLRLTCGTSFPQWYLSVV